MPETKILDAQLGSRHRAALGITEETDAVVVVVSEERGTISFCFSGNIVSNLDGASLGRRCSASSAPPQPSLPNIEPKPPRPMSHAPALRADGEPAKKIESPPESGEH